MPTFDEALSGLEAQQFVGRARELALFEDWLAADTPAPEVLTVSGRGGVGKSALLRAFARLAQQLEKPVVLLEYPGENHSLARPANQQDYTVRMKEFFDHHLKGAPAPDWLEYGVPRLKMQEHIDQRLKERADKDKAAAPAPVAQRGSGGQQ